MGRLLEESRTIGDSPDTYTTQYAYDFTYDANGNMTAGKDFTNAGSVANRSISYTPDNLPSKITHDTGNSPVDTYFYYDGDGVRVKKTGSSETLYVGDYFEITDGKAVKFVFGNDSRLAKVDDTGISYFHKDHLGSTTIVTNAAGAAVEGEATEYKPFGEFRTAVDTDSLANHYRFTDQEFDPESNLYNYDARYYDPALGRFISADTVTPDYTDPQSLNRYSYVKNNPLVYVDPTGHYGSVFDEYQFPLLDLSFSLSDLWSWTRGMSSANLSNGMQPMLPQGLGYISAAKQYMAGTGGSVTVDATTLKLIKTGKNEGVIFGAEDYAVHGNVGLNNSGQIKSGDFNFDQKPSGYYGDTLYAETKRWGRNGATMILKDVTYVTGAAANYADFNFNLNPTPFKINYSGKPKVIYDSVQ